MFERPYDAAPPAILTEDQSAVAVREIQDMLAALHHLSKSLTPGAAVDRNLIYSILYVSERRLTQLGTITGVDTDSAEIQANRSASLRTANERVRQLEHQLGGAVTAEQTRLAVAALCRKLKAWWRAEGLGHVHECGFDEWGNLKATLSCTLFGNTAMLNSDTPVSDKATREAWLKSLQEQGFVMLAGQGSIGHIAAGDTSRDALLKMIHKGLPSAEIQTIATRRTRGGLMIQDVTVGIADLSDIEELPAIDDSCL